MRNNHKISVFTAGAMLAMPNIVSAATAIPDEKSGSYNLLLVSLVSLVLILLFIIGILSNTLRNLGAVVRDRIRKERKAAGNVVKSLLLAMAFTIPALNSFAAEAEKAAAPVAHSIAGIPLDDFYIILMVLGLELIVIFGLVINIKMMITAIVGKEEAEVIKAARSSWFWEKFNAAKPLEQEKDILMDHDYDGIRELDNSLPPWWKYGFYLTIIVAVIYLYRFHISHDAPSSYEEYVAAMQKGEEDKAAYLAKAGNNIDENNVKLLTDPADVGAGKDLFLKNCAPCHLPDGGGIVGPNLTDDYWLHGGSIKDVFKTIKYGWQDKGMKSWKDDFSAKQIQQLASFVKSLRGTKPLTPKAPQGTLYVEAGTVQVDSTAKPADSAAAAKK